MASLTDIALNIPQPCARSGATNLSPVAALFTCH